MIKCINIDSTANVGGCDHFQREDCDGPVFAVNVMVIVLVVRGAVPGDGISHLLAPHTVSPPSPRSGISRQPS